MSDFELSLMPTDPWWRPDPESWGEAERRLISLVPRGEVSAELLAQAQLNVTPPPSAR
ncbi:MAG: hypothetical protein ACR2FV_04390 [Ornithinimicrobium sp.]|uniref:hypothetical protein n=1 Tax=Ornithinimicrobium sp. TaxID=1977084 RepID=UPI003D9B30EF